MIKCNCDISKCKAHCCYNVPIPKGYLSAHKKKIVNKVLRIEVMGEYSEIGGVIVKPITDEDMLKNKCPFLREDCKCNIYDIRPRICRDFGTRGDENRYLRCSYLSGESETLTVGETEMALLETFFMYVNKTKK